MAATHQHQQHQRRMLLSPEHIASLPPEQQVAYMQGMTPEEKSLVHQAQQNKRVGANRRFMRESIRKYAYCPVAGGSGITAAYTAGSTLVFDLPVVPGFATDLLITYNLSVTPAAGTNALYVANAAAPYNIFSEIDLLYNGPQVRTHPYVFKLLDQLRGWLTGAQNRVLAGNNDSNVAAQLVGSTPVLTNVANTWQGKLRLRLNALGEETVPGLLPIMGVGNKPQLKLTCAPNFVGVDPLLNPISGSSGSNFGATVTGTINVDIFFLDGSNTDEVDGLKLDMNGEPTLQYYWDTPLNPLNANLLQRQHINTLLEHYYVFSLVIDGNQSTSFATINNLTEFELTPDSVGQQKFMSFNVANNVSVYDYYQAIRNMCGQDLDEGVVVWIAAPNRGIINPANRTGRQVLNMRAGHFPATSHGYMVGSVGGVAGITPRVETFLISLNRDGLRAA